jgi:hypothetical protein
MNDIYETTILCNECNKPTDRIVIVKEGLKMRGWECKQCKKHWPHPHDLEAYKEFQELKRRQFQVKLRQVGNSWAVSIPKEIIRFKEVSKTEVINMSMDEPGKIVISFKKIRKIY